ncbi:MAG: hypothetical protein DI626_10755 [Micavibrio aeruginosavorus]|uniref:Uncharacterized protein n=1 Tax=Micavibrio aeruginosavorus TaxID=349221 RepID=A0A2W4ZGM2_9BACT|nr:MAG: hypothetical protein DI626_10755 [Micavibrio aeruginosavorus]
MALNDVALCSRALIRIGAAPIASFADGTAESEIAGALFAPVRDAMLSSYPWSFAYGQAALAKLSQSPLADYQNAFQLPNDFLRAISAGQAGRGRGLTYRIARGALHTNADDVVLSYIFRPEEEEFPPYFDMAMISRLAAEFCIPVTENTSRADALYRMAENEFARARQIDAQQDTPGRIENFSLTDVRG